MPFFGIILKLKIIIIIFFGQSCKFAEGLNFRLLRSIWSFSAFLVVYFKIFRALEQMVPADAYELTKALSFVLCLGTECCTNDF